MIEETGIEGRLASLEERFRRDRRLAATVFVAAAVFGLVAAADLDKATRSKRLVIEDDKGRGRIELGADEDGPYLNFLDENKKDVLMIVAGKDGSRIIFADAKAESVRMSLTNQEGRGPMFGMQGPDGKRRLTMMVDRRGNASVLVQDADERVLFRAPEAKRGPPR